MGVAAEIGTVTVDSVGGTIGGSILNLDQSSFGQRALIYPGQGNLPTGQQMSILIRCAFGDTTNALQMFYAGGMGSHWANQARASGAGTIVATVAQKDTGASLLNQTYTYAYTTATYYDIVYLIDGSLTTSAVKTYRDGSLVVTSNTSATRSSLSSSIGTMIGLGIQNSSAQNQTRIKIEEFVIWDSIIDPTSVTLTSGSGSLNGASRSAYVDVVQSNGGYGPARRAA
jgi:hypothetical protein